MRKPSDKEAAWDKGERLKLNGMTAAARNKRRQTAETQFAFLTAMAHSADLIATADDTVDNLRDKFQDGGKWRGQALRSLSTDGIIRKIGHVESNRSARHCGTIAKWQGVNRQQVEAERQRLERWLTDNPLQIETTAPGATSAAVNESPLSQGASNDA